jgi:hypothetical protein
MKSSVITFILIFNCMFFNAQTDSVYYGTNPKAAGKIKKEKNNDWLKKFTYGGSMSAFFSNGTYINFSPTIGYLPIKKLNVGAGFIYNYYSKDYGPSFGKVTQTIYGGQLFARYMVGQSIFLQAQYLKLLQPNSLNYSNPNQKIWVDYALVGGGYRLSLGTKAALITSIMYNLTYNQSLSIYPNPIILQVGFVGGF